VLLGAHVSCAGGIHCAIDRAEAFGCDAVQVFTQSPRMWRPTNHDGASFELFKERAAAAEIEAVLCHALYLVNLASPDDEIAAKSVAALANTIDVGCGIGAEAVVFHVGSHLGSGLEAALERVAPALRELLERCPDDLWLAIENSAGGGGTIGRSLDELVLLFAALDHHPSLGICLDSCHLWASGYDITDPAALDELLIQLDESIGLDRLRALHVNDSQTPLGSNRDRHANMREGLIGDGLSVFLGHPALQGLPCVLEVPGHGKKGPDAEQMRKLRELHARGTADLMRSVGSARRRGRSGSGRAQADRPVVSDGPPVKARRA
jgi:deoxyribonuclease IV